VGKGDVLRESGAAVPEPPSSVALLFLFSCDPVACCGGCDEEGREAAGESCKRLWIECPHPVRRAGALGWGQGHLFGSGRWMVRGATRPTNGGVCDGIARGCHARKRPKPSSKFVYKEG